MTASGYFGPTLCGVAVLKESGSCVVHIISEWMIEAANHTCAPLLHVYNCIQSSIDLCDRQHFQLFL
jgi:hypothetical protein